MRRGGNRSATANRTSVVCILDQRFVIDAWPGLSDDVKAEIKRDLERGVGAIKRLAKFSPWIAGDTFTYADLVGYFAFFLGNMSAKANADTDLLAAIPGAQAWFDKVGERGSVKQALADQAAARRG